MADPLAALQAELERFGAENDAAFSERGRRMLNVTRDTGELLAVLVRATDANAFDLVFLDSERSEYPAWWPSVRRTLRPGGLLVVDNATSHRDEMAAFAALVTGAPAFTTCLATVGKGELLAVKQAA